MIGEEEGDRNEWDLYRWVGPHIRRIHSVNSESEDGVMNHRVPCHVEIQTRDPDLEHFHHRLA